MSYVLDALKKSDREYRLQQGAPDDRWCASLPSGAIPLAVSRRWHPMAGVLFATIVAVALVAVLWAGGLLQVSLPDWGAGYSEPVETRLDHQPSGIPDANLPAVPTPGEYHQLPGLPAPLRDRAGPLRFSLHVFSEQPAQRSIIINDRMMREGERLNSVLILHAITADGVIMASEGRFYRLAVVNDWQQ